jgi:hypothetical protein
MKKPTYLLHVSGQHHVHHLLAENLLSLQRTSEKECENSIWTTSLWTLMNKPNRVAKPQALMIR